MPSKSKSQQRLFGMVDAYQKGDLKNPSKKIKDIAKEMPNKEVKKFAKTKRKGLPNKVKKTNESVVRINEEQLKNIVVESVKNILREYPEDWWKDKRPRNKYQIVAYLINPWSEEQKKQLGNDFDKVEHDYKFISDVGNPLREKIKCLYKYKIDNGAIEEHPKEDAYFIDEDNDGLYLLKRI